MQKWIWAVVVFMGFPYLDAHDVSPCLESCEVHELKQGVRDALCAYRCLIESLNTEIAGLRYRLAELEWQLAHQEPENCCQVVECYSEPSCEWEESCYECSNEYESFFLATYEVWADALYWHPFFGGVGYGTVLGSPSRVQEVDPEFDWGYKLGARIYLNCDRFYVGSEFFHYTQQNNQSVVAPGALIAYFAPAVTTADAATAKIESKYEAVDITAGYLWLSSCCWESFLFAGARYIFAKESEFYLYDVGGTPTPAQQCMTTSGWGPRIGCDVKLFPFSRCRFLNNFGILGAFAFSGIIGEIDLVTVSQTNIFSPEGDLVHSPGVQFIPGWDLKLEALYSLCMMRVNIAIRGGYELHSYLDARQRLATTNQIGSEPLSISSLGYGGPYFGLSISY